MNSQQLLAIRQQILDSAVPLVLENDSAPADRFDLILRFLRYTNGGAQTSDLYKKAYESAIAFETSEERLEALLQLLGEIDAQIDNAPTAEASENSQTEQPVEPQPAPEY